jgi:hypothetical protein
MRSRRHSVHRARTTLEPPKIVVTVPWFVRTRPRDAQRLIDVANTEDRLHRANIPRTLPFAVVRECPRDALTCEAVRWAFAEVRLISFPRERGDAHSGPPAAFRRRLPSERCLQYGAS